MRLISVCQSILVERMNMMQMHLVSQKCRKSLLDVRVSRKRCRVNKVLSIWCSPPSWPEFHIKMLSRDDEHNSSSHSLQGEPVSRVISSWNDCTIGCQRSLLLQEPTTTLISSIFPKTVSTSIVISKCQTWSTHLPQ